MNVKTDPIYYRLFKDLPESFFELMDQPLTEAGHYRFDSVELKQSSLRIDGVFRPTDDGVRPIWFVEIQFYRNPKVHANLFAKVFQYLERNDWTRAWRAVVLFASRTLEPKENEPYRILLESDWVRRVYLDELPEKAGATLGYGIMRLVGADEEKAFGLGTDLVERVPLECSDASIRKDVVELIEAVVLAKFPRLSREELQTMLKLEDVRKSRIWQEAREEGLEEGIEKGIEKGIEQGIEKGVLQGKAELIPKLTALGWDAAGIARFLDLPEEYVAEATRRPPQAE